jgi:hypothetical protein
MDQDVLEPAYGFCPQLDGITVASKDAIADAYFFAIFRSSRLEDNGIIPAFYVTVADSHPVAAINVNAVIVVIDHAFHADTFDQQVFAGQVMLNPHG